jgi:YbgC/YbaW family acyl-CoA thioester hydrolase
MHMIFRTILIFLKKRYLKAAAFDEVTEVALRVLPTDLDLLWHVNNGVYFSFMDFGRWSMIFRNGIYDLSIKKGWYSVVSGETIKFRRSLKLWDKFTIQTKVIGHDEKYFFIRQRFICREEIMATGLVKVRFLKRKGGTVSTHEVLKEFKIPWFENEAQELGQEWAKIDEKFLVS